MNTRRFLLDGHIYNLLGDDTSAREDVRLLIELGETQVVATPAVVLELQRSPFGGIPPWFQVVVQPEGIAISGLARSGMARSSAGRMYRDHLGQSRKVFDAVIAHSAHSMGATLVSDDRRCRERLKRLAGDDSAITYAEFRAWLQGAVGPSAAPPGKSPR